MKSLHLSGGCSPRPITGRHTLPPPRASLQTDAAPASALVLVDRARSFCGGGGMTGAPLAIDLFCGLFQAKFLLRANAAVKKLVAGGAQNPNHVGLCVRNEPPCAVTFMRRAMGYLKNTNFATGLAGARHFRPPASEPVECCVFELPLLFIEWPPLFVFSPSPLTPQFTRSPIGALDGAIALVSAWRRDQKMRAALGAVSSFFRGALVLVAANAPRALGTVIGAPFLVGLGRRKGGGAQLADQLIHRKIIT